MSVVEKLKNTFRRRPKQLDLETYLQKLQEKGLHKDGKPILDPVPIAPPIGYKKHPSMVEIVRDMVRSERLAQAAHEAGHESFEEAEDFSVEDDPEQLRSPFENEHDPDLAEILAVGSAELKRRKEQAIKDAGARPPSSEVPTPAKRKAQAPPSDGPATPPPDGEQDD